MKKTIAVLLTCHNRKDKTFECLTSLNNCIIPSSFIYDVYLVDDGSTDGTANLVKEKFPKVKILYGNGKLYWAGGMLMAWKESLTIGYDFYMLLNDDVVLLENVLQSISHTHDYAVNRFGIGGIYVCSTLDKRTNNISYGGATIKKKLFKIEYNLVIPSDVPINCQITNANILFVCSNVVERIGIFDPKFIHALADYDYSLTVYENNIPLLVCPGVGGYCEYDHGNNWLSANSTIKERIDYLYSPLGLAYKEYLYYIRKHFPFSFPYLFIMLWIKTIFPIIWDKFKKQPE